jgi:hypothetical protein
MVPEEMSVVEFGVPEVAIDLIKSAMLPGAAAQGYRATPTDVSQMALDTMLGGGLLGRAPSGSLAANVWHGGPHRWAAEPGFPYGRPRLDKMGTGEGAQAYGPGFYTAESKGVGTRYRDDLTRDPDIFYKGERVDFAKGHVPHDATELQRLGFYSHYTGQDLNDTAYDLSAVASEIREQAERVAFGKPLKKASEFPEWMQDVDVYIDNVVNLKHADDVPTALKTADDFSNAADFMIANKRFIEERYPKGTLYKLDIPDADAAKTLDWDAPLSEQGAVGDKVTFILEKLYPDTKLRSSITGEQAYNLIVEKSGSLDWPIGSDVSVRRQFYEVAENKTADALREAGIPGVKYLDRGSRGAGEGSRNYAIWDQDVLDRTKMLERDGEILGLLD